MTAKLQKKTVPTERRVIDLCEGPTKGPLWAKRVRVVLVVHPRNLLRTKKHSKSNENVLILYKLNTSLYCLYFLGYQLTLIARSSLISSLPFPAISIIRSHRFSMIPSQWSKMSTLISSVPSPTISIPLSHWLSIIPSPGSSLIFSWFSPSTTKSAKSFVGLYCNKQHNSNEQQSWQTALHCDGWEDSLAQDWEKPMSQCVFVGWKISRSGRDPPGQIVLPWHIKYVGVNWSINAIFHPHIRKLKTGGTL